MTNERGEHFHYFRAIEEAFIRLRGAPFLLSPSDWRVANAWFEAGVPLEVVVSALETVFERREERGATAPVQGLRYCRAAVDEAWQERRELGAEAPLEGDGYQLGVGERLARLADALPELPAGVEERAVWAVRVRALTGSADEVERQLAQLDRELMTRVLETLSASDAATVETETAEAVAMLAARVDAAQVEEHRDRLLADAVRRRLSLPVLSLFAPEARNLEEGDA